MKFFEGSQILETFRYLVDNIRNIFFIHPGLTRRFWIRWLMGWLLWVVGSTLAFAFWIDNEVKYEYATGLRTSSDGDIIAIPIAGFFLLNLYIVSFATICAIVYGYIRKRRTTQ